MMRFGILAASAWLMLGSMAAAEDVVVELYTSQGCSSCPPADRILGELASRDDVIPLAFHVDYWDYLGWKDQFASAEYTKRQRSYARAKGERSVYTPQMVIAGQDHVIGSRAMKVSELVQKHGDKQSPVQVHLERKGDRVIIRAQARQALQGALVELVTYLPEASVNIKRGENAGRTITYYCVVQSLAVIDNWDGRADYNRSVKVAPGTPVVVLIQERRAGPILGASRLR